MFALVSLAINTLLLLLWISAVTPNWVRTTAHVYAERLLGVLDTLQ